MSHHFDPVALREYDIRGIVGKTLGEADAYAIGRTFGTIVRRDGGKCVAVGYDGRLSSPSQDSNGASWRAYRSMNTSRPAKVTISAT